MRKRMWKIGLAMVVAGIMVLGYGGICSKKSSHTSSGSSGTLPAQVTSPNPADEATDVSIDTGLTWTAASGATSYDVYFGLSDSPPLKTNTTVKSYNPGALSYNITYYWRINTRNAVGTTQGNLWSFTTEITTGTAPDPVASPDPTDGATGVAITKKLGWGLVGDATSYDVYFGITTTGWSPVINTFETSYDPGTLDYSTDYYWRIDSKNEAGTTEGLVWDFTTEDEPGAAPAQVTTPDPAHDADDVSTYAQLFWGSASGAISYDVYFGTTSPGTFKGNQPGTTYDPGALNPSTVYYWRIDSKNLHGTTEGNIWDFETGANYSISGTIAYAGPKTGRIYINVYHDEGGRTCWGTSIAAAPGAYIIRGLQPGNYQLYAYMDHIGYGAHNAANPGGDLDGVTIDGSNATGKNITLKDPPAPTLEVPESLTVFPGDLSTLVFWRPTQDGEGNETAEAYNLYWKTSDNVSKSSYDGCANDIAARDDTHFFQTGLTNGTDLYYVVTAEIDGVESADSAVVSATIGAPAGPWTVSGTVSFPGTPTGPLCVGCYSSEGSVYITSIASPTSPQDYSVEGVQDGTYFTFAIIDMDNNGLIGIGDIQNVQGESMDSVTVAGGNEPDTDITLTGANANFFVYTAHEKEEGVSESYNLDIELGQGKKMPVKVELTAGPNIMVPMDIAKEWMFEAWFDLQETRPTPGDTYTVVVTYSDASQETLYAEVTGVLDCFAQNLVPTGEGVDQTPTFTWEAPAAPPASYSYGIDVWTEPGWNYVWEYPEEMDMPSSQTSVLYNIDGYAALTSLDIDQLYHWSIYVIDSNGNEAELKVNYTPK